MNSSHHHTNRQGTPIMQRITCLAIACLALLSGCTWRGESEFEGTLRGIEPFASTTPWTLNTGTNGEGNTLDGRRYVFLALLPSNTTFVVIHPPKGDHGSYSTKDPRKLECYLASQDIAFRLDKLPIQQMAKDATLLHGTISFRWTDMGDHKIKVNLTGGPNDSLKIIGKFSGSSGPQFDLTPIALIGVAMGLGPKAQPHPEQEQ